MRSFLVSLLSIVIISTSLYARDYKLDGKIIDAKTLTQKIESKFFEAINKHRAKIGLNQVVWNQDIAQLTKEHAVYVASYNFSQTDANPELRKKIAHENYNQRNAFFDKILKDYNQGGEITYVGYYLVMDSDNNVYIETTVNRMLEDFLRSPNHKRVIEKPYLPGTMLGIATTTVDNRMALVANFVGNL